MVAFNKFNSFVEYLAEGVFNLGSDDLVIALTNVAPVAGNSVMADLTQISSGAGYTTGGLPVAITSSGQSGGTYRLVLEDLLITADGGALGPFRYIVLADDTPTSPADPLIGWWDYGSELTLQDQESLVLDFHDSLGVLQVA